MRYAPTWPLPPYSYVPGHGLPHPVNDPAGHLQAAGSAAHAPPLCPAMLAGLPADAAPRRLALDAALAAHPQWRFTLDLFNEGFYWEAHEAWEGFWLALGRTTPDARVVQGLIHLAAAAVKIREPRPAGVARHARRGQELLGELAAAPPGGCPGLAAESVRGVVAELSTYRPACWHSSRTPVVRVIAARLRLADLPTVTAPGGR
jgi:hypothetical protein